MEVFEILKDQVYQSGAPEEEADWRPIHDRKIDIVVDLFGTLDPGVPTEPNSILYIFWPIRGPCGAAGPEDARRAHRHDRA